MMKNKNILFILLGVLFLALQSPKWLFPLSSWLAPIFILLISRNNTWIRSSLLILITYFISGLLGGYEVMPFPIPVLIIVVLIGSLLNLIPYLTDKFLLKEKNGYWKTLIFPSTFLLIEYININSPSGVWQSISGTQHSFLLLAQSASIIGIWGIVFLVYWLASTLIFIYDNKKNQRKTIIGGAIFTATLVLFLGFGLVRLNQNHLDTKTVKVAAITLDNSQLFETIYNTVTGKKIEFRSDLSQTSPEVTEVNKAFVEFLKDSENEKYMPIKKAMTQFNESVFKESSHAVQKGSKIIVWSEGLGISMIKDKINLIKKGQSFAKNNNIYLLLAYGAFFEGEPKPGEPVFENRIITFNPKGEIVNEFQKNKPVPFAEQSAPGDGKIPVIKTPYANISPSICYDADFPELISQTGRNETELLLIPTGDWQAISPYHSYITKFRAIENGISILKSTSRGLSVAFDPYGRILKEKDFFDADSELLIVDFPIKKVKTFYSYFPDWFLYAWFFFLTIIFIIHLKNWLIRKVKTPHNKT